MTRFEPLNLVDWFWGDIKELDAKHRRLRIKFHNCVHYRAQVLDFYIVIKFINKEDIGNLEILHRELVKIHGTRLHTI